MITRRLRSLGLHIAILLLALGCGGGGGGSTGATPNLDFGYTLTLVGPMQGPRHQHSATLLNDGRVFLAGGYGSVTSGSSLPTPLGTTEFFDPGTNRTVPGPALVRGRAQHTATKLPDGRVYLIGGAGGIECYDPGTNTIRAAGRLQIDRHDHSSILLPSGKILVVGGESGQGYITEVYDPATEASVPVDSLHTLVGSTWTDRSRMTIHLLGDGRVMVAGGFGNSEAWSNLGPVNVVEIFDPATNQWSLAAPLSVARSGHGGLTLPTGKVMILGGMGFDGTTRQSLATTEIYDPATGRFTPGPSMLNPRHDFQVAALPDGRFYISGGQSYKENLLTGSLVAQNLDYDEVFDPVRQTFSLVMFPTGSRYYQGLAPLKDGSLCITGGITPTSVDNAVWLFRLKSP